LSVIDYGKLIRQAKIGIDHRETDYTDENGFIRCGICNKRRERLFTFPAVEGLAPERTEKVPMACDCDKERYAAQTKLDQIRKHTDIMNNIYRKGITEPRYKRMTFDRDDCPDSKPSKAARLYSDSWTQMRVQNIGMILSGNTGSGKTFRACCIANALAQREVPVMVITMPELILRMADFGESREEMKYFISNWASLLVIDDFGAERGTDYSVEKSYEIVDMRYRAEKPLIITTNIPIADMQGDGGKKDRIYDRIMEMCPIRIKVEEESHRRTEGSTRQKAAMDLMSKI